MSAKKKPDGVAKGEKNPSGEAKRAKKLTLKQRLIKAMAHPLRVRILAYMNDRPWSPSELSEELAEGLSQVSYHVKVLNDYELIEMTKTEPRRGAVEHYYRAIERVFMPSSITKQFPKSAQRGMFVDTMEDTNKDVVASLKSGRFDERDDYHVSYTPADFDGLACKAAEKLADKFVEDFIQLGVEADARRTKGESEGEHIPTSAAVSSSAPSRPRKRSPPPGNDAGRKKRTTRDCSESPVRTSFISNYYRRRTERLARELSSARGSSRGRLVRSKCGGRTARSASGKQSQSWEGGDCLLLVALPKTKSRFICGSD